MSEIHCMNWTDHTLFAARYCSDRDSSPEFIPARWYLGSNALDDPFALTLMLSLKKMTVRLVYLLFFMSLCLLLLQNAVTAGLQGALFSCGCGMRGKINNGSQLCMLQNQ